MFGYITISAITHLTGDADMDLVTLLASLFEKTATVGAFVAVYILHRNQLIETRSSFKEISEGHRTDIKEFREELKQERVAFLNALDKINGDWRILLVEMRDKYDKSLRPNA